MNPFDLITDSIFRAPTIGSMLMGLCAALVGCITFVRRRSLVGESLSHATYPGVGLAVVIGSLFSIHDGGWLAVAILVGAALSAVAGLWLIDFLERRLQVRHDSALCFVLAGFFGVGLTIASRIQFTHAAAYRQIEVYLYGQAATMTDIYIWLYSALTLVVVGAVVALYKEMQVTSFDREFALSSGVRVRLIDRITLILLVVSVIMGIRSVGVVLMSAMLIGPAVAARQFTHRLKGMFWIAGGIGLVAGFAGNYLSVVLGGIPTGPTIVIVVATVAFGALLFAPQRGLVDRLVRSAKFRFRCRQENILKAIWHQRELKPTLYQRVVLASLVTQGWVDHDHNLTAEGKRWAGRIIRLHRLWEVYLVDHLGCGAERVHRSAEEMEHIITPELERELTELLNDPSQDPHDQPIPPRDVVA